MKFISDSRYLLDTISTPMGDAACLAQRLSRALDIIEADRATMLAAYNDLMKRYDAQAANRLRNRLNLD